MKKKGLYDIRIKYDGVPLFNERTDDIEDLFRRVRRKVG